MKRCAAVVLSLLLSLATAGTLSVPVGSTAFISGPLRGQIRSRAVLSIPLPEAVEDARLDFAKLEFPSALIPETSFTWALEAFALTTAWQQGRVSWTEPWRNPGGDFDSVLTCRFTTATTDSHPIVLDITKAVKRWQQRGGNVGLILKRPDYEGGGFGVEGLPLYRAVGSARVKFYFTRIQQ